MPQEQISTQNVLGGGSGGSCQFPHRLFFDLFANRFFELFFKKVPIFNIRKLRQQNIISTSNNIRKKFKVQRAKGLNCQAKWPSRQGNEMTKGPTSKRDLLYKYPENTIVEVRLGVKECQGSVIALPVFFFILLIHQLHLWG